MDDELRRLAEGGQAALGELFSACRDRLERMVRFRLDPRLRGRVDPEDVLQDACIAVTRRLDSYLADPRVSFYVWVRQLTWQTLIDCHRVQTGRKRDPKREVRRARANATTFSITRALLGRGTSPSGAAARKELIGLLHEALDTMGDTDREVLALRHFEQLCNREVAEILNLSPTAASNRYVRALKRLGEIMASLPGVKDAM